MLFQRPLRDQNDRTRRLYAAFEIVYTAVDFLAAMLFVVGSIMFFSAAWERAGTWLFLIGSLLFAAKPTLRLVRELRLAAMGDTEDLAERIETRE